MKHFNRLNDSWDWEFIMPRLDSELVVVPLLMALGVLVVVFGIALFVEWYRGWPGWPFMRDRPPRL